MLRLQASHKNLASLTDFYTESSSICLVYEYVHLAIPLGGLAGIVDFSEAEIVTVCGEILNGLVYMSTPVWVNVSWTCLPKAAPSAALVAAADADWKV